MGAAQQCLRPQAAVPRLKEGDDPMGLSWADEANGLGGEWDDIGCRRPIERRKGWAAISDWVEGQK
jgi:hypothetical protein